jgi:hypothetical protein
MHTFLDQKVKKEKTTLIRIKLNEEGYTSTGVYYGVGEPLYWYAMPDGKGYIEDYIRARDRDAAKAQVVARHPMRRVEFYV